MFSVFSLSFGLCVRKVTVTSGTTSHDARSSRKNKAQSVKELQFFLAARGPARLGHRHQTEQACKESSGGHKYLRSDPFPSSALLAGGWARTLPAKFGD